MLKIRNIDYWFIALLAILLFDAVMGCSVSKMVKGRKGIDISEIRTGISRLQVEEILGKSIRSWTSPEGVHYCLYKYDAGRSPNYREAAAAACLDIITLGAWEIFEAASRNVESYYPATTKGVIVSYDPHGNVLGVFDQFDILPSDGRIQK